MDSKLYIVIAQAMQYAFLQNVLVYNNDISNQFVMIHRQRLCAEYLAIPSYHQHCILFLFILSWNVFALTVSIRQQVLGHAYYIFVCVTAFYHYVLQCKGTFSFLEVHWHLSINRACCVLNDQEVGFFEIHVQVDVGSCDQAPIHPLISWGTPLLSGWKGCLAVAWTVTVSAL